MNIGILCLLSIFISSSALSMQKYWPHYNGFTMTLNNGVEVPGTPMMTITKELDDFRQSNYKKFEEIVRQARADKLEMDKAHEILKCEDSPDNWPQLKFLLTNIILSGVKEDQSKLMLFDPTINKKIRPTFFEEAEVESNQQ